MLVNSIDISTWKAKLLKKDIQTAEVTIYDDWLRNALNPLYLGKQETFKALKINLLIEDTDDQGCLYHISNLVAQFTKCTVKFDNLDLYYDCTLASKEHERLGQKGYFALNVELKSGYAYKAPITETLTQEDSKVISVGGNASTPAILTITTPIDTMTITVTGFKEQIVVNNLVADVPRIIDGEACTVLQAGVNKFADVDMWEFPSLKVGENTITTSDSNCTITINYKPKFM